ncbi:MAG TPA: hypothetical protein VMY77_12635 [Chitinophagaceae bacterium]|nr:hypothetical protein [Chitinophagaceae bacterium]
MKKVSKFVLALFVCATAFVSFSAFSNQNSTTVSKIAKISDPGEWVEITFNRRPNTFHFVNESGLNVIGTWVMNPIRRTGQAFHCVNTLTYGTSVLVATSNCNNTTMNGVWHIVSASGIFEGMSGNGSLEMFLLPDGRPSHEVWEGTIND